MTTTSPPGPAKSSSSPIITLRLPSKYASTSDSSSSSSVFTPPPLEWLHRTWSVTHSTLSMWRTARNVRITYTPLPPLASDPSRARIDDLVEYEASSGKGGVKSVAGTDTASSPPNDSSVWDWRGKGWLFFVGSHWEVLGCGEHTRNDGSTERWVVTWFKATVFTKEGLDIYSDRKEGASEELVEGILAALRGLDAKGFVDMADGMLPVEISLPWKEK
ncbi:hypothetical protein B0H63DRAFT_470265 [Podospora didyma]|uniref:Uncharacterized protein n=1 Tax=Podospora didyma TaxID=330526 RepID=A0AAE0NU23_9PEZI|nr:hypothetical protein B0H63DRAFT_470265 [Podospora didyma]